MATKIVQTSFSAKDNLIGSSQVAVTASTLSIVELKGPHAVENKVVFPKLTRCIPFLSKSRCSLSQPFRDPWKDLRGGYYTLISGPVTGYRRDRSLRDASWPKKPLFLTFPKLSHCVMYSTSLSKARHPEVDSTPLPAIEAIYLNRLQRSGDVLRFIV